MAHGLPILTPTPTTLQVSEERDRAARRWRTAPPQLHVYVSALSSASGQATTQVQPDAMPSEGSDRWWRRGAAVVRAPPPGQATAIEEAFGMVPLGLLSARHARAATQGSTETAAYTALYRAAAVSVMQGTQRIQPTACW